MSDRIEVSPLSPARQCARSYSLVIKRPVVDRGADAHALAVDERGYDADLLVHVLARPAAARRAVQIQRFDFLADDGGSLGGVRPRRDAEPDLIRPLLRIEGAAVKRRAADQVDAQLVELGADALADDLAREPGTRGGIVTAVADLAFAN